MTIKEFVSKAIEGGWETNIRYPKWHFTDVVLDPKAWQACGKVEGWVEESGAAVFFVGTEANEVPEWHYNMLKMIDALAEGKSLEQFIKTL